MKTYNNFIGFIMPSFSSFESEESLAQRFFEFIADASSQSISKTGKFMIDLWGLLETSLSILIIHECRCSIPILII